MQKTSLGVFQMFTYYIFVQSHVIKQFVAFWSNLNKLVNWWRDGLSMFSLRSNPACSGSAWNIFRTVKYFKRYNQTK